MVERGESDVMIDAQIWEVSIKLKKPETEVKNQNPFFFNEKLPQDLEVTYGNCNYRHRLNEPK